MFHNKSRKNHDSATMSHISNKTGVQAQTEAPTPKISQPAGRPLIRHQGLAAECFDQHLVSLTPNQLRIKASLKMSLWGNDVVEGNSHKKKLPQKPLKCPVSASVFCVVCVCASVFSLFVGFEARIMDKVGVCPHLDVLMLVLNLRTLCLTAVARSETLGMPNIDFLKNIATQNMRGYVHTFTPQF